MALPNGGHGFHTLPIVRSGPGLESLLARSAHKSQGRCPILALRKRPYPRGVTRFSCLIFAALLLFSGSAQAAGTRTCRSGTTVYEKDGVRVFEAGRSDEAWYACGPTTVRPRRLWSVAPAYGRFRVTTKIGEMVIFEGDGWGEGGGENTFVGWFDARTSEVRLGELAGGVSNEPYEVALAADGGLGLVVGYEDALAGLRIGYLGMSGARGKLRRELVLATPGPRTHGTLAFADGDRALTWKLHDGTTRSVPLTAEPVTCTAGTTLVEGGGARVFEVFPLEKTRRGFQKDVLAACARGATTPQRLAVSDVYDQQHWDTVVLGRSGERTRFQVGWDGIGVLDGASGTVGFTRPRDVGRVKAVAVADSGEVVFAGQLATASATSTFVARLDGFTGGWERLASLGGADPVPGSLAVEDGRVRWRVEDGLEQSTSLAGETASGCASGTALIARDGLRVFEVLPAGTGGARLLACFGGEPLPLLDGPRDANWLVTELAREGGRVVLHAAADAHADWDHVLTVGPDGVRVTRSGNDSVFPPAVRDVALARDGRVALAVRGERRWRVIVYGARERTVARTRGGVRAGSLRFAGRRVVWRDWGGRAHSAPLR